MSERSKRDTKIKLDKLAEYKRAREGGRRVLKDEEVDVGLYDEVTEDQYKSIVKGRLQQDDFVVDDGFGEYMDNGMEEDWGGANGEEEEEEDSADEREKRRKAKKKAGEESKRKPKPKPAPQPAPSMSAYRPAVSAEQEEDFMASILGELDAPVPAPRPSRKRKTTYDYDRSSSPPIHDTAFAESRFDGLDDLSAPPSSDDLIHDTFSSPKKKVKTEVGITPRIANMGVASDAEFDDIDMDAFNAVDDDDLFEPVKKEPPPIKALRFPPKLKAEPNQPPTWLSVYDSLSVNTTDSIGASSQSAPSTSRISALEPDGSLRFFWLDYLENEGRIHFIGKLKDKTTGVWVSCCVTVENMQRNLFILPREKMVEQVSEDELVETDIVPQPENLLEEFDMIRRQIGIKSWKSKFVKRKYAFELSDVPKGESQWLKVVYGFNEKPIPATASSPSISRIFGTNTSAFELLVLKRKIMGPCWLQVKNPMVEHKGFSWCKLEATVSDPKDINPFPETDRDAPKDMPSLTVLSLSVRTIVNHQENKREIVCATSRVWQNIIIDDPTPPEKLPCTVNTFVRPLDRFPPNFENAARTMSRGVISPMKNERMLLNSLLVTLHKADPDVIVGHEFLGISLDVLLQRMRDLNADHWSRIGRFRRTRLPIVGRQGTNIKYLQGRLLCDLSSDAAKSMISSTTWSLTEMCRTHLSTERQDIDPDETASYFDGTVNGPDRLLTFVRHCELDAHFHMAIASKVQMLPLTKQLTNLAGNSWNKTLNGGRAERNEYILLHEFHRLKYVCPDKAWGKKAERAAVVAKAEEAQDPDDPSSSAKAAKGKKDKYKGGLVFDPKRGLWDKFILVMDFNSLYPSIIQEYNIDFTTVERNEEDENATEEKIAEPPAPGTPQGVLPRLIATLVSRRKAVKSLMKDKNATPAQRLQWDIKQQALKLTANSMYGCLGYEFSRFFARPLAALTTFKGREILTHTRELAESLSLDVVYGDTDSVFVNSGVTELDQALKISAEFKKAVNEQYKLLEIDLDSVFQRLLLLQKKKYAALKIEDASRTSIEIKGLDMKRREYCALSKTASQYVLDQVLSGNSTEEVVDAIHEYLQTISQNIRDGKIKVDEFIIFKRLGKNPEDYPDAKSQPHVQVALRMKGRGLSARNGDVIPYIFCLQDGEAESKLPQAERARHPDEVRKAGSGFKLDYEYYLAHQVLPPIERLCDPIEGTDRSRLAECLGLDPGRYRNTTVAEFDQNRFSALDSQMSDRDRFANAAPFIVQCRSCKNRLPFAPIFDREASILQPQGTICSSCGKPMTTASLQAQLESQLRSFIAKYYEMWAICDEPLCGNRTRSMSVYGRRCLKHGCRGNVSLEYSDAELYNQLRYFSYLFDAERAIRGAQGTSKADEVARLTEHNATFLRTMMISAEKYLDQCGRRWVELGSIFSFMKL